MDAWSIALVAVIVVGAALVVFGALWDRARNRRRAAEMLAPPARPIPRFRPDAPSPQYLSELQARRPPAGGSDTLDAATRTSISQQLDDSAVPSLDAGYASADFVTDRTSGWAVLDQPVVLVCADEVSSIRELLGLLERLLLAGTGLVLVAPGVAADVLSTLEVNVLRRRLAAVVVLTRDPDELARVAATCGTRPSQRSDRQAGYLPAEELGRCERWVSTARSSHVVLHRTAPA